MKKLKKLSLENEMKKEAALEDLIIANQLSPSLLEYMEKDDELVQLRQMPAYQNAFSVK